MDDGVGRVHKVRGTSKVSRAKPRQSWHLFRAVKLSLEKIAKHSGLRSFTSSRIGKAPSMHLPLGTAYNRRVQAMFDVGN